jgi:curved DNA-binding protein CbpA
MNKNAQKTRLLNRIEKLHSSFIGTRNFGLIKRASLLENIADKFSPDFLSDGISPLNENVKDDIDEISNGIMHITKYIRENDEEPIIQTKERKLSKEEIDEMHDSMMQEIQDLISNIGNFAPSKIFDLDLFNPDLDEICEDKDNSDVEETDNPEEIIIENNPEQEIIVETRSSLFPAKEVAMPSAIEGGMEWNKMSSSYIRLAEDLSIAGKMLKTAINQEDFIEKEKVLIMLDPSKYDDLDDETQENIINAYAEVANCETTKEAQEAYNSLVKTAYYIMDNPELRDSYDRIRQDGSYPYNYQKFITEVGESHHKVMGRLNEQRNPINDLNPLRLKDGERSHPMKPELANSETRMQKEKLNNTEHSPRFNLEQLISELDSSKPGHLNLKEYKAIESILGDKEDDDNLIRVTFEERATKNNKNTLTEKEEQVSTEGNIKREDNKFEDIVNDLLDEWREDNREMTKASSNFGGGNIKGPGEFDLNDIEKLKNAIKILKNKYEMKTEKKISDMTIEERLGLSSSFPNEGNIPISPQDADLAPFVYQSPTTQAPFIEEGTHGLGAIGGENNKDVEDRETAQHYVEKIKENYYPDDIHGLVDV